jgi:hypothetical protein
MRDGSPAERRTSNDKGGMQGSLHFAALRSR